MHTGIPLQSQHLGGGGGEIKNWNLVSANGEFKVILIYMKHCLKHQKLWNK